VYEVLWLKELGLLFGNTAQASATGLAVFFAGIAAGGWFWGSRASRVARPLLAYAWLEIGIAVTAAPFFWMTTAYRGLYGPVFDWTGGSPEALLLVRIALALLVLFPPAFFMGGTTPLLGEAAIPRGVSLGRRGARLYALNTAGAALGACAAGFYLPAALGYRGACLLAIAINLGIAVCAVALVRRTAARDVTAGVPPAAPRLDRRPRPAAEGPPAGARLPLMLSILAGVSGFLALALQVAATRLFAQVLQNSVYTFSTILVVFLLALAAGSAVASRLARSSRAAPTTVLTAVLVASGIAVAAVPYAFFALTDGMRYLGAGEGWSGYVGAVFRTALIVLGIPAAIAGIAFPFLLRFAEATGASAGRAIGRLSAANTAGAIAGSLVSGFVLLPWVGLWRTFSLLAAGYLAAAIVLLLRHPHVSGHWWQVAPAIALAVAIALVPVPLPVLRTDPAVETVLDVSDSVYGITAVVERGGDRGIRVNNYYSLGGSGSLEHERNQALLPLMVHPDPRQVFFLGMGTGITAGAAVQPPVDRLVVAELIPDVIAAARLHFHEFANGLFKDPRVQIIAADGRDHLAGMRERYDLVIADLFVPWEAGTGSLYTREHFQTVGQRLTGSGVFVQWLPLYQMSRQEFTIIARTMMDVFPHVTAWRGDFFPDRPILALVGSTRLVPLDPDTIARRGREIARGDVPADAVRAMTLPFYAGHLSLAPQLVPEGPLNTDDKPIVEYLAPVTQREQRAGTAAWFTGLELVAFFDALQRAVPPDRDPYLAQLDRLGREWVRAGFHYHAAAVHHRLGQLKEAAGHMREFESRIPPAFRLPQQREPADRFAAWDRPAVQ
jgi:spermidine synthase